MVVSRLVLHPRAYLTPAMLVLLFHHLPLFGFWWIEIYPLPIAVDNRTSKACYHWIYQFRIWLAISLIIHAVVAVLLCLNISITLYMKVYRRVRPENYLILGLACLYFGNAIWDGIGFAFIPNVPTDELYIGENLENDNNLTSRCWMDSLTKLSRYMHEDFVITCIVLFLYLITAYTCGGGAAAAKATTQIDTLWKHRCLRLYQWSTCSCYQQHSEPTYIRSISYATTNFELCDRNSRQTTQSDMNASMDVFDSLGKVLADFFRIVTHESSTSIGPTYLEHFQFQDLILALQLVAKRQKSPENQFKKRYRYTRRNGSIPEEEQTNKRIEIHFEDIAYYGKLAIGIYGWPVYMWYSPYRWLQYIRKWFRWICFYSTVRLSSSKPSMREDESFQTMESPLGGSSVAQSPIDPVVDHDNLMGSYKVSFQSYTGISNSNFLYLSCSNDVFQSPFAIVKDFKKKQLILTIRGSLSFSDLITDSLALVVAMDKDEIPEDAPCPEATRAHCGMLETARRLLKHLQTNPSCEKLFWTFAEKRCRISSRWRRKLKLSKSKQTVDKQKKKRDWSIVVCGHSMGGGVGCILTILLRAIFKETKAVLFGPPMVLDPISAIWSKNFVTTVVFGDDLVPRLSLVTLLRLRDELMDEYAEVANERLFNVRFRSRKSNIVDAESESTSAAANTYHTYSTIRRPPSTRPPLPAHPSFWQNSQRTTSMQEVWSDFFSPRLSQYTNDSFTNDENGEDLEINSFSSSFSESSSSSLQLAQPRRVSRADPLELRMESLRYAMLNDRRMEAGALHEIHDVDLPGLILHVQLRDEPRQCSCIRGAQPLTYSIRDAAYFRRIWVSSRTISDHFFYNYDSRLQELAKSIQREDIICDV